MSEHVVLLHGIWMPAGEMMLIKRHLEAEGDFSADVFSYASVRGTLDENARRLADFVTRLGVESLHLVGHSLGGIVALRAASQSPFPPGRIVCLGSPLCGSAAASGLTRFRWGQHIAGQGLPQAVLAEPASSWAQAIVKERDVGVIAGDRPAGMGRFLTSFEGPNDGTVSVAETELGGIKDHLIMHVSHSGMVLSKDVAEQTEAFLRRGEFLRSQ